MGKSKTAPKAEALKERRSLNPNPEKVTDKLFLENGFFDPRDMLQVKYEMLRRVRVDGEPISLVARRFGFSRPSFYLIRTAFEEGGLPALLPKKTGPHGAHKLTEEIMEAVKEKLEEEPETSAVVLVELVRKRFGVSVHRRTVERALARMIKKKA